MSKAKQEESPEAEKAKAGHYALKNGHQTPFRRTIDYGEKKGKAQMIFNPGETYDLTALEVEQCQDIIDSHLLVEASSDEKGRVRYVNRHAPVGDSEKVIADLEKKVESLSADNAELLAKVKSAEDDAKKTHNK